MRRRHGAIGHDGPVNAPRPLTDIRVLDFTRVLSGPHCGRMLTDLGADVIKIEPPAGDLTRYAPPRRNGLSSYFVQQNVGKRNISIDLASDQGVEVVRKLARHSDVVLENYRPGVMARLGLGADELCDINRRLIYASISGYGQTGPWVKRRAYAAVVEAEAGIIASQGNARGGPLTKDPHSHADVYTAVEAATGIIAALFQRERSGRGQRLDISMAETMLYVNEHLHDALWDGDDDPQWIRSFRQGDYLVLTVANGESLVVSGHPAERGTFDLFTAAMGRPDLADDPRFADVAGRLANFDALADIIRDFAAGVPDADAFEAMFAEHQLAVGQVRQPGDLAATEWAVDRGAVVDIDDRAGGTIRVPNVPWRFSDAPDVAVAGIAKYRGEDNRTVLHDILGYDNAQLDDLESSGILSSRIPSP
jgi:CoA:oxalate CoA-transferase